MDKFVVTIGRQFGSMGRPIAKKVAETLGIGYYDRDIVEEVSKRMHLPINVISNEEEEAGRFGKMIFPLGRGTTELQDHIFAVQECVLHDFADKEPCILVGRCADYVMRGRKNLLRIYICAPFEDRIKNCINYFHMSEKEAEKMCKEVDKARIAYHKRYAGYSPLNTEAVDLMINSATYGIDETAQILVDLIKKRFDCENEKDG